MAERVTLERLKSPKIIGLGVMAKSFLSTPSFLYDHFLTLAGWTETNDVETSKRFFEDGAIGIVDIVATTAIGTGTFYYGGILREVTFKGLSKITFKAKGCERSGKYLWGSSIGILGVRRVGGVLKKVYSLYQSLPATKWVTRTEEDIGFKEPLDGIWITSSPNKGSKVSVDMIRLEA